MKRPAGVRLRVPLLTFLFSAVAFIVGLEIILPGGQIKSLTHGAVGLVTLPFHRETVMLGDPPRRVPVESFGDPLPNGCSRTQSAKHVSGFLESFTRGNRAELATYFGTDLKRFGDGSSNQVRSEVRGLAIVGPAATDEYEEAGVRGPFVPSDWKGQLLNYFEERHKNNDRTILLKLRVGGANWSPDIAHISFKISRKADDMNSGNYFVVEGKGAIGCPHGRLIVWGA